MFTLVLLLSRWRTSKQLQMLEVCLCACVGVINRRRRLWQDHRQD